MDQEMLTQLGQALVEGSLTDEARLGELDRQPTVQILPEANVIKVGGQSFIDRGRAAVFPLIDELVENLPRHKMLIGTGAGTRARHAYSVGLDLGMPTGVRFRTHWIKVWREAARERESPTAAGPGSRPGSAP